MRIFLGHFGIRLDDNRGESLVEVLVSAVIMGLLGLTIVGTIALSQPLSDRVNLTGTAMANLNSASQQISGLLAIKSRALSAFFSCHYTGISKLINSCDFHRGSTNCSSPFWGGNTFLLNDSACR
jgi:type II secretory pathway pseudopilin PulG